MTDLHDEIELLLTLHEFGLLEDQSERNREEQKQQAFICRHTYFEQVSAKRVEQSVQEFFASSCSVFDHPIEQTQSESCILFSIESMVYLFETVEDLHIITLSLDLSQHRYDHAESAIIALWRLGSQERATG